MQTRKRGHKRIKGGLLEEVGPAQTQEQADANARALGLDASKPDSTGLFKKAKDRFRNVGTGIASLTRRFRPAPPEAGPVNQVAADNAQPVDSSAAVGANPPVVAPVKIKPDNLLVPMVINLENNYVLVGSGKFMIKDGNVAKEFIKDAYNKYIEKAKERLAQPNATGDVATVVRQIVFEEFKDIIRDSLINNQLDSAIDYANYANELAMGDLFYKIICVRLLPDISDEDKITEINKILITPDEIIIEDQSKQLEKPISPADEAAIESLRTEFAPAAQGLAVEEAAKPIDRGFSDAASSVMSTRKAANAFKTSIQKPMASENTASVAEEETLDMFGVGEPGGSGLPEDMNERYKTFFEKHKDRTFYQLNSNGDKLYLCTLIDPAGGWFDEQTRNMKFRRTDGSIGSVNNYYSILPIKSDNNLPKPLADVVDAYLPNGNYSISDDNVDHEVRLELACVFGNRQCKPAFSLANEEFEANASKELEKEKDQDFEGGARSKKTRKRRQKRSKRKTVHYLRKRR